MNISSYHPYRLKDFLSDLGILRPVFPEGPEQFFEESCQLAYPALEIKEDEDNYYIEAEAPGLTKKDLEVVVEDGILTLKGEKKAGSEKNQGKVHRSERYFGSFSRSFLLPENVNPEEIRAHYGEGILTITLPKSEDTKSKQVDIKIH